MLTSSRIQLTAAVFCAFIIIGLFTSSFFRVLPSIGIGGLTFTAIAYAITHRHIGQQLMWKVYLSLTVVFFLHLLSGFSAEVNNRDDYYRDILLQSPFLLLPISFWLLPPIRTSYLIRLWMLFFVLVIVSALGSTIYYLMNFDEINEIYIHSQVMPTEPDHIRFSLMISLAIAVGIIVLIRRVATTYAVYLFVLSGTVFLVLYQHLLAVRSGLITFYVLGLISVIWLVFKVKNYKIAATLSIILLFLPVICFLFFPTFRNKFYNTQEDIGQVSQAHSADNYSLTGRIYSYKVAMLVAEENLWLGVGNADMEQELAAKYRKAFPAIKSSSYIKPHNQFVYSLVAFGLLGLMLFVICFYYPLIWSHAQHAPLLFAHYCILTLSFLVEYTLETQIGLTFSLIFLMLSLEGVTGKSGRSEVWRPA